MKDKFRYVLYPERIYTVEVDGEKLEISGKQIVERIIDGQKNKEAERKTSEFGKA